MKTFYLCLFLFFVSISSADEKKTICLNMIVKNESKVITRCLESVKPIIDYWVIQDNGSTDGTQKIIKEFMKDIPGELHEQPWVNFAHNRNEALKLAKGKADYILFIDADEVLAFDPGFKLPALDKDFYYIMTDYSGTNYLRVQMINNRLNWKWAGVVHECVDSTEAKSHDILAGVRDVVKTDGARSQDPKKFQKDAELLEAALKEDPANTRTVFYLAQSYRDAGDYPKAIENYEKRIDMGGWDQEVFWSMLQVAVLQETLNMPPEKFLDSYFKAYHYKPDRAEPLYRIANYYRRKGNYIQGYLMGTIAQKIPPTPSALFLERWMYDYGILLELSICAYWIGKYDESQLISMVLLNNAALPIEVKECVQRNKAFADDKLVELYRGRLPDFTAATASQ